MAERKELIRPIIQRVMVAGEGRSERLRMTIEGVGAGRTAGLTTRPMSHIAHLSHDPRLCERIRTLLHDGYSTVQITALLAQEGFRPPKHVQPSIGDRTDAARSRYRHSTPIPVAMME